MSRMAELHAALNGEQQPQDAPQVPSDTVTAHRLPVVGESVAVLHASQVDDRGFARLVRQGRTLNVVTKVLMGSEHGPRVMVRGGDVWDVRLAGSTGAVWETHFIKYQG